MVSQTRGKPIWSKMKGRYLEMNKKLLSLLLSGSMMLSLAACGGTPAESQPAVDPAQSQAAEPAQSQAAEPAAKTADDINDNMTSADGKYQVAFITDVGQLKDKSFNQGTYDGVKLYADANVKSHKYYQPANGDQVTDDDRYDAMKAAVDGGAEVVVCAGFMQEASPEAIIFSHSAAAGNVQKSP